MGRRERFERRVLPLVLLFLSWSGSCRGDCAHARDLDDAQGGVAPLGVWSDEETERRLGWLREQPLDLTSDPLAPLEWVPGVAPGFAERAEHYRGLRPFRRPEDLMRVPGVDAELIARLRPFVFVPRRAPRTRGQIGLVGSAGALRGGSASAMTARFARGADLQWGVTAERDPRESDMADYHGWWLAARRGAVRLVAGELDVDWGSGIVLSTAWSPAGADAMSRRALRGGAGLRPHRGRGEEGHLRGLGASLSRGRVALHALYADTRRDARVGPDGLVTSVSESGLHRTPAERAVRDRLREGLIATRLELSPRGPWRFGVTARASAFEPALGPGPRSSLPSGSAQTLIGSDLGCSLGPLRIGGEAARRGDARALLGGARLDAGAAQIGAVARRYDPDYRVVNVAPPGRFGRPRNESGRLFFLRARVKRIVADAFLDHWRELISLQSSGEWKRGVDLRVSVDASHRGRRFTCRWSRRVQRDGSVTAEAEREFRDALRVATEHPLPAGVRWTLVVNGVRTRDADATERGGFLQTRIAAGGRRGLRVGLSAAAYAGDSGDVVPRLPESFLPGPVRFVSLASRRYPSGWRFATSARRAFGPTLRLAAGAALHAPRRSAARGELGVSLEVGPARPE